MCAPESKAKARRVKRPGSQTGAEEDNGGLATFVYNPLIYPHVSMRYPLALSIILALTPVLSAYGQGQEYPDKEKPGHRYVIAGGYSAMLGIGLDGADISAANGIDVSGGLVLTKWLTPVVYASFHSIESVGLLSSESESGSSIGVFGGVKLKSPILLYASLMGGTEIRTVAPTSVAPALQAEGGIGVPLGDRIVGTGSVGYRASSKAVSVLIAVGVVLQLD